MFRQILNLFTIISAFAVNVLANVAPINNLSIGEIANTYFREVQIIPANYAFAIWGLIYIGLISFGIYQLLPVQRHELSIQRMGYLLVIACLSQIVWVLLFQYRLFTLSFLAMLGILLPLIGIYLRLGIGAEKVSQKNKWFVHIPLSIYLGWISVATIVNGATTLYNLGWSGWGISASIWTVIMIIIGAVIAAVVIVQRTDVAFPLVFVWALIAIAVRQSEQILITVTAGGSAIALILLLLGDLLRHKRLNLREIIKSDK